MAKSRAHIFICHFFLSVQICSCDIIIFGCTHLLSQGEQTQVYRVIKEDKLKWKTTLKYKKKPQGSRRTQQKWPLHYIVLLYFFWDSRNHIEKTFRQNCTVFLTIGLCLGLEIRALKTVSIWKYLTWLYRVIFGNWYFCFCW